MNIKKIALSFLMVLAFIVDAFSPLHFLFEPITVMAVNTSDLDVVVHSGDDISASVINYNGQGIGPGAYITVDGVQYPAFCVDPDLPGADYHPNRQYPIKISGTNNSAKVATVLHNSVPYVTKADILSRFPGLSDQQIYAATKAAVRAVADQSASNYPNDDLWKGDAQTIAFAKYLINLAKNNTEDMPQYAMYGTTGTTAVTEEGDFFVRTTTVQSTTYPLIDGTKIKLTIPANAPSGTVITLEDDTPIPSGGVDNETTIKIKVPKSSVSEGTSGSFEVEAEMTILSAVILFGVPTDEADKGKYQRYEVSIPSQTVSFTIPMEYTVKPNDSDDDPDPTSENGGLKILKYDNVTGNLTPDAIFEVKGLDDSNKTIMFQVQASSGASAPFVDNGAEVTLEDGVITVSGLPTGKYQIKEISPPPHYDMSPDGIYSQVVEVQYSTEPNVYPQVIFRNNPYGSLKITKIDAVTGKPVPDATLRIRNLIDGIDITRKADSNGVITLEDLPQGNYSITEVNAGEDYELNPCTVVIPVRWGSLAEAVFTNEPHTSFEVTKINSKPNTPVAGTVFTLKQLSTGKEWTLTTLDGGKAVVNNIPAGDYTLTEIYVPEPLILDSETVNIKINNDKINSYTAVNDEKPIVTLEKYDEKTGELLGGAEFRLERLDGAWQTEFMVDSSGKKTLTVAPGTYRFTEIAAPDGYLIVTEHKDFVLNPNDEITIKFDNRPRPVLEIKKIDTITGLPLSGARFKVTKTEDLTVSEYITDASGTIIIKDLDEAIYTVEEIVAPDGYILNSQHKEIKLEWGKTKTLIYENTKKPTLIVTKINGLTYLPIPNTTYKIEYEDTTGGIHTLGTYRTDGNGQIVLPKVEPGWYIITETIPAPGFSLSSNPVTRKHLAPGENAYTSFSDLGDTPGDTSGDNIQVTSGNDYLTSGHEIINYPLNSIVIRKAHAVTGELLAGAAFEVRKVTEDVSGNSGTVIGRYTTDNSGVIVITGLEAGGYIIEEVQAPQNFLLSENSTQQAWLKPDGTSIVEVTFANYPYGHLLVTKVDAQTNTPLAGARFKVTDSTGAAAGNTNGEYVTDVNGEFLVSNLKPGSYVVTEIEAPENYAIDTTPQTVNIGTDGKTYKVSFKNQPAGTLILRKLDTLTKEPLADAQFKVTTSGGNVVGTGNGIFTTDATGTITIPNLPKGSYIVEEIKAPDGYILENQSQSIEIDYGKSYTLDFYNKKMSGLQIIKIDSVTKQPLKNAEFALYKQNGELIGRYTTDADGVIIIDTLSPGWYKVVETKTPDGYILDETPQDVQITDNQFVKLVFENAPMSALIIRKVDADTRDPLEGAEFTVKMASGLLIGIYRSGTDGMVTIPALEPGWYTVTETKAPDGYTLGDNVQTVEITHSKTVTIEFQNRAFGSLIIKKIDEITGSPLSGANFTVYHQGGELVGEFTTGNDGTINIPNVAPGWYVISETKAPTGYTLDSTAKTVEVKPVVPTVTTFTNKPLSGIEIIKTDAITHNPLSGATFIVERANGEKIGTYKTDASGKIIVSGLTEGTYIVSETIAPNGYMLNETPKTVTVTSGKLTTVEFANRPYSGIEIIKTDAVTHVPLAGATFTVERDNGEKIGTYKTDTAGKIIVPDLPEGTYIVSETIAPDGYRLDNIPQTVVVKSGKLTSVEFVNTPYGSITIKKTDEITGSPLSGADFTVKHQNGEFVGDYTTGSDGVITIPVIEPSWYVISETKAPVGYHLDSTAKTIEVKPYNPTIVTFTNKPYSGIEIIKMDSVTKAPLSGATFTVERDNGEKIGTYKTDASGKIIVPDLTEGTYIVSETIAPDGYMLHEIPKTVIVTSGKMTTVEFENKPFSGIQIIKLDAETNAPLPGATFVVDRDNGERLGTYKTDSTGKIIVSNLAEGTYIVSETIAPEGYILDEAPKTVIVKSGKLTTIEFMNKPLAGLKIIKLDSDTRNPIEGVDFVIAKMSGEKVENDFRGYTFTTDKTGQIFIPNLTDGYYTVTETRTADGYILDGEPKTVLIQSGKSTVLEVLNTPMSGLLIVKTDENTGKPLEGVVFDIKHADGSFVTGNILDGNQPDTAYNSPNKTTSPNGDITGSYTTDANGRILINGLDAGQYTVTERKALNGYELDTDVHNVTVLPGKLSTLQLTNKPLGGIRIIKIDSMSKKPIYNVEFMLFDSSNKVVGVYYTDNNGIIDFPHNIPEGRYTIRETRAASGYYLDEIPKTVEFVAGQVTEIVWTNTPQMGQIQIIKKSGDDNEINGFPSGTLLAGAVFEAYDYKTGNLVDRFVSGADGKAVSSPLPLGRYIVKEVQAPQYYKLSDKELDITIEFATQIIKQEYLNYSANTGVYIKKTGNAEAMPGDLIKYDIKAVQNTGTVPLTDFYWRDVLPADAVRLNKIVTGTYNQSLKYKILVTTNKGDIKVIADNLSTTKNNVIDCSSAALGLKSDEFVTSFTLVFGTVKAGFAQVETPQIYVNVLKTLKNGYQFANKCDVGGKYGDEWVVGNSTCTTTIYSSNTGTLPKTGY